jgi:Cu(I)/Ag(I) efflux system membrane fusion protein
MKLVPKKNATKDSGAVPIEGSITLLSAEAVRANVQTVKVEQREFIKDIQAVGTIKIAEPGEHIISSRTRGRIERLYVNATGKVVRKGDPLYDYYSPDLLNAEQEYLLAIKSRSTRMANTDDQTHANLDEGLIAAGKERLRLYGLGDEQIAELERKNVPNSTITIHSPESGIVLQKLVQEGSYIDEGTSLFQLADLSLVWAEIEIPESDIRFIHDGYPVSINTTAYPSEEFNGKVIFISPVENPESHTITVRLALPNPKGKLRPEMFVSALVHINMGNSLAVPASAVIRTGSKDYIWVRNSDGSFSNRSVTLGAVSQDNYYQVLDGINKNDEVASSGQFLIDSEHQFAMGANPMAGMNMDAGNEKSKSSGEGTGIVRSIDKTKQTITIDHGNLPGVMSAMTMGYKVSNPAILKKTKNGDHIKFILSHSESGEYVITSIKAE